MNKKQIELGINIKKVIGHDSLEDSIYKYEMDGHIYDLRIETEGDWVSEGKYQTNETIAEILEDGEPTGIYLRQFGSRMGDHWHGYECDYEIPEIVIKTKRLVEITEYKSIKA